MRLDAISITYSYRISLGNELWIFIFIFWCCDLGYFSCTRFYCTKTDKWAVVDKSIIVGFKLLSGSTECSYSWDLLCYKFDAVIFSPIIKGIISRIWKI
jgi:hypothetical protein